jgi:hypothetical protein
MFQARRSARYEYASFVGDRWLRSDMSDPSAGLLFGRNLSKTWVLGAVLIANALIGCAKHTPVLPPVPQVVDSVGPGDIVGVVLDSLSHAPVLSAQVFVTADSTARAPGERMPAGMADVNGRFAIRGVKAGTYTLVVQMISYRTRRIPVRMTSGSGLMLLIALSPVPCPDRILNCP